MFARSRLSKVLVWIQVLKFYALQGGRINLDAQIDNYANTREEIISILQMPSALRLLRTSLFSVTIGSNDFINNYLTPILSVPQRVTTPPENFIEAMISKYRLQLTVISSLLKHSYSDCSDFSSVLSVISASVHMQSSASSTSILDHTHLTCNLFPCSQLQRLYNLDARKIVVANIGPIGCIPYVRDINPSAGTSCVAFPNQLAQRFNERLKGLVMELSSNLKGSLFVYANVNPIVSDIIQNCNSYGT